jgi:hypothetical protein
MASNAGKLSSASIVVRRSNVVEAEVDGEVVALDVDKGTCYGLNKVGTRIWKIIVEPSRVGDLCSQLATEYQVDNDTCERDVIGLLEELLREDMIEVNAPVSGS